MVVVEAKPVPRAGTVKKKTADPFKKHRTKEFLQGYNACADGVTRKRNPYERGTYLGDEWEDGWCLRFHGEEL